MAYFLVNLNTTRNLVRGLPEDRRMAEARRCAKICVARHSARVPFDDSQLSDTMVNDEAVQRFLEIEPPIAAVIPEFQEIVDEIEGAYVAGMYFAALSAANVSIERMLNLARIELHPYHTKIKQLWGKGPSNAWGENIDALESWGYLGEAFAAELRLLYSDVRNRYLHSGPITDMRGDAVRSVNDAYRLLKTFLGFPEELFRFSSTIECLDTQAPRFKAFYAKHLVEGGPAEVT